MQLRANTRLSALLDMPRTENTQDAIKLNQLDPMLDVESSSQWMPDSNITEEEQRIMLIKYDR